MIDIIITFVASEGVPALILYILAQRTGFVSDGAIISALAALGGNNVLTGLIVLEFIQLATIFLTLWGIKQVICDLFFQEAIEHSDDFKASMEVVRELPVSPIMHALVIRHIISHHHSMIVLPVNAEVFIRVDRDDPKAWTNELDNVRFMTEEGMSGSAQFSADQFHVLAEQLREQAETVWIIDCRMESHGLVNGIAVSWCGEDNGANSGLSVDEIEAEEQSLSSLIGTDITAYTAENDLPVTGMNLAVETWETERELVESEGFHYLRLACPDHCWPPTDVIDAFIAFASGLEGNAWLHFHCQAGSGRTGAFMTIYEMMQKPEASVEEILQHQAETGSGNLLDRAKPEKSHAQKERCVLARAVYLYIQENRETGYALKWSDWLEAHSQAVIMKKGDSLDGEGFSSDPLVVSDSLEAVGQGKATVLTEEGMVLFITID